MQGEIEIMKSHYWHCFWMGWDVICDIKLYEVVIDEECKYHHFISVNYLFVKLSMSTIYQWHIAFPAYWFVFYKQLDNINGGTAIK